MERDTEVQPPVVTSGFSRGVNLGGAFDRRDGRPGWRVLPQHLETIATAGFDSVRLPVRWWGHSTDRVPHLIDSRLLDLVRGVVDGAREHGLSVVLTMHHADAVCDDPVRSEPRLVALWRQLSAHFAASPGALAFELLNEPRGALTSEAWNRLLPTVLRSVREVDAQRWVVVGGAQESTLAGLRRLELPSDPRLVATLHYYEPFSFTHQGAPWISGSDAWRGRRWGSDLDHAAVTADLEEAATWATRRGVGLYVGELGTIEVADHESRVLWTRHVRREAERLGLAWACWDFATDFGLFDLSRSRWRPGLVRALGGLPAAHARGDGAHDLGGRTVTFRTR